MRRFSLENNLPPKGILLLDNCTAHAPIEALRSDDGNIIAMLLPPNVTAVIQPMDQNPIKIVKLLYRNKLLSSIIGQEDVSIHDLLSSHSIRDAILFLKLAWDELPQNVLKNSWKKIFEWDENQFDEMDNVPLSQIVSSLNVYNETLDETHLLLSKLSNESPLSNEDIETWNGDIVDLSDNESSDESDEPASDDEASNQSIREKSVVPFDEAINAVSILMKWTEINKEYSNKHMSGLIDLRLDIVKNHISKPCKQQQITEYFSAKD